MRTTYPLGVTLHDKAIAAVLDLVDPFRPVRNFRSRGLDAGFNGDLGMAVREVAVDG
jgi:hypothetical protein